MTRHLATQHLFVYGTLLPPDVRWPLLAPFVVDTGWDDHVDGTLYDTGLDYPAAVFGDHAGAGRIAGRTFTLLEESLEYALEVLDTEEDTVVGLYRRVEVVTGRGVRAWAYGYGSGLQLVPIGSGDWLVHRGLR